MSGSKAHEGTTHSSQLQTVPIPSSVHTLPAVAADDTALLYRIEWCNRRVLARIHRMTLAKLRKEIEPVSAAELMRFLLRWQRVSRRSVIGEHGTGPDPRPRRRRNNQGGLLGGLNQGSGSSMPPGYRCHRRTPDYLRERYGCP